MELECTHFGKTRLEPVKSGKFKSDISGDVVNCFKLEVLGEGLWFDEELIVNRDSLARPQAGEETLKRVPVRNQLEQLGYDLMGSGKKIKAVEKCRDVPRNKENEFREMDELMKGYMSQEDPVLLARNRHLKDERYVKERKKYQNSINVSNTNNNTNNNVNENINVNINNNANENNNENINNNANENINENTNNVNNNVVNVDSNPNINTNSSINGKSDGVVQKGNESESESDCRMRFEVIPKKKSKREKPKKSTDIRNTFFKRKLRLPESRSETYLDCSPLSSSSSMPSSMSSASSTSSASSAPSTLSMSSASSARPYHSYYPPSVPRPSQMCPVSATQWDPRVEGFQHSAAGKGERGEWNGSSCGGDSGAREDLSTRSDTLYDSDCVDGLEVGGYDDEIFKTKEFREYYEEHRGGRNASSEFAERVMDSTPTVGSPTGCYFGVSVMTCCGVNYKREDHGDDGNDRGGDGGGCGGDHDEDDDDDDIGNDDGNDGGGNDGGGNEYDYYSGYDETFDFYETYVSDYDEFY